MRAAGHAGLAVVAGVLALGAGAPPPEMRAELETLGLALDRAVFQVSRPSRTASARGAARGYRLEGYGAMFVLAPRVLPLPAPAPTAEEREMARVLAEAARELERRLPRVASDDVRIQLQQSVRAMRQSEADIRLRERMGSRAAGEPIAPEGALLATPRSLEDTLHDLERDVQAQLSLQTQAMLTLPADSSALPPEMRAEIEASMRFLNERAGAFAAEAERARQEAERVLWGQLGLPMPAAPARPSTVTAAPGAVPPPDPPAPPAPFAMLPPWQLWIDPMDDPTPDPQGVIDGVSEAVTSVLEQHGTRLRALAPQEMVAVAVDFVPANRPGARMRAARTLTVRARKADIDERAAGRLTPAQFRERVEVVEY